MPRSNIFISYLFWSLSLVLCITLLSCQKETDESKKKQDASKDVSNKKTIIKQKLIYQVTLKGAITPSSTEKLSNAITKAEENKASALIVTMDTPGGLVSSTDDIIRRILSAEIPIITYISPLGAACGSAGVYILYASHIAAMAPATNIGSATPVSLGGFGAGKKDKINPKSDRIPKTAGANDALNMKRKLSNHARAQIRSLAQYHGRNAKFGEDTITKATNLSASEAYKRNAIDIIAKDKTELIAKAHGRLVHMNSGKLRLSLKDAKLIVIESGLRHKLLDFFANPNLAYFLMMLGILGIIAEVKSPGLIFPGVVGSISMILGLYAFQTISIDYTGLALIGLSVILFILEFHIISYGLLSLAGLGTMTLGAIMLVRNSDGVTGFSITLIIIITLITAFLLALIAYLGASSQRATPSSGYEKLLNETGISKTPIDKNKGTIFIHGETWQARSIKGTIAAQSQVRILSYNGLVLNVEEIENEQNT